MQDVSTRIPDLETPAEATINVNNSRGILRVDIGLCYGTYMQSLRIAGMSSGFTRVVPGSSSYRALLGAPD